MVTSELPGRPEKIPKQNKTCFGVHVVIDVSIKVLAELRVGVMEQASGGFMSGIRAFSAHLPLTSLLWPYSVLWFFVWIMSQDIYDTVVLSAPLSYLVCISHYH